MRSGSNPVCPHGPSRRALLTFAPIIAALLAWAAWTGDIPAWRWLAYPFLGFLCWTFVEYAVHRWLFHIVPESQWLRNRQQHLAHHAAPQEAGYFVIPLWLSLPVAALVWLAMRPLARSWREAAIMLAGAVLGYVAYELIHYEIHLGRGRGRLLRFWRRHHLYHHHKDDQRCFGFTTSLWDVVFDTARPKATHAAHSAPPRERA